MKNSTRLVIFSIVAMLFFMNLIPSITKYDTSFFVASEENSSYEDVDYDENIRPRLINISKKI